VEAEKSSTELAGLQETARRLGFDRLEERASERLAAITSDPVDKMRLTFASARLLESKKDIAGAARVVDTLYRDHPLILGVLRGAVDFHVRNRQPVQAMDLLLDASKHARADLAAQFTLEAARIATGAGQFDRARTLLTTLQHTDPLRAEYFAAMADIYLRAKDDAGFRDYQIAVIQTLKQASLPPSERTERIATIRRSLVPAFDRLRDAAGAVDQYIQVLNSYPEDEALTKEVAAYAVAHGQAGRLVAFYRKTAAASPLDYRWPVVLGRVETVTEDYASAIADYELAIKARPDRADVVAAKARLEERLMRFDDAIRSCRSLYELAYRDPQWLIKVAELEARAERNADAVAALKTAIIGARKETAEADFQVAEQLESWHILPDAVSFAEHGATLAGAELFKAAGNAVIYARIMARSRRMEPVLDQLGANPSIDQQVAQAAGKIIAETYTPEEKVQLERAMTERASRLAALLPLAESAGLAGLEARWRQTSLNSRAQQLDQRLVTLQSDRGAYAELGRQLEDFAATIPGRPLEATALAQSVEAFINEGDPEAELRVMRKSFARNALSGLQLDRYLALTVARQPDELLAIARTNGSADNRNRAAQFAIASGRPELAYPALRARGSNLPPVWTNALTALAGEYFGDRSAAIDAAFQAALDTRTIGERLRAPLKPDSVITGTVWFYYGARYGDYLAAGKSPTADAWLPASLEGSPQDPGPYMALGDSYAEAGKSAMAITQFEHALELDPDRGDALDHIARLLWREGRRPEAIARWKAAIGVFMRIQGRGIRVPEPFWARVGATFTAIGENHALEQLRGDIANLLSDYYHRNSTYRLNQLLEPAVRVSITSGAGVDWLVQLGQTMGEPQMMLSTLMRSEGLTPAQRIALQRELVGVLSRHAEASFGDDAQYVWDENAGMRQQLISMLLDAGDIQAASAEWRKLPEPRVARHSWERDTPRQKLEIRLAAKTGTLGALLERYREESQSAPDEFTLREAALELRRGGIEESARSVLEFVYEREIRDGHMAAANFLGLSEVKLQGGDPAAAVSLLNRMQLVSEEGNASLLRGAGLLGKYGRTAESVEFIRKRIKAEPWDAESRLQLGRGLPADSPERRSLLASVVADSQAAYPVRAQAARLAGASSGALPGTELAILSAPAITPAAAGRPYQLEARMEAARGNSNPEVQARLWREALAIAPADEAVRLGTLRAAIAVRHDSVALALNRAQSYTEPTFDSGVPVQVDRRRSMPPRWMLNASVMPKSGLTDEERASLAESLASAAERQDDLNSAQGYLKAAMSLRPESQRQPLKLRLDALAAEQDRRIANGARQPIVKDVIEQGQVVRQQIPRSVK
jgi:tetratricopeptide (TPR) repeat protein